MLGGGGGAVLLEGASSQSMSVRGASSESLVSLV